MYRIAICDDDTLYTDYLEHKIKEARDFSEKYTIYKYYSGEEFVEELEFDLVFLDMQMGKIDGITAALKLRKQNQDAVLIFCTKDLKERVFYFIVFFTIFAGVEIIFEFILSLIIGEGYQWERQTQLSKFIIICLEKLTVF